VLPWAFIAGRAGRGPSRGVCRDLALFVACADGYPFVIASVVLRLVYLAMRWLALFTRSSTSKDAETLPQHGQLVPEIGSAGRSLLRRTEGTPASEALPWPPLRQVRLATGHLPPVHTDTLPTRQKRR